MNRCLLFRWGLGCLAVGLVILGIPESFESPVLVEISQVMLLLALTQLASFRWLLAPRSCIGCCGRVGVSSACGRPSSQLPLWVASSPPVLVRVCWWRHRSRASSGGGPLAQRCSQAQSSLLHQWPFVRDRQIWLGVLAPP